jgi:hypothetical protein
LKRKAGAVSTVGRDADLRAIAPAHAEAAHRDIALRHRVNLPVRAIKRRQHQRPAAQGRGLPQRRDSNVDPLPRLGEGGQFGGDDHRRGIAQRRAHPRRERQAEPARNPAHRLGRVGEVVVARAREADDDAIAGQLVGAQPFELAEIADALGMGDAGDLAGDQGDQQVDDRGEDADTVHGAVLPQNGEIVLKKRLSQPGRLACCTAPLPV